MKQINNILLFLFLLVFTITLVNSAPPTTTVTDYQRGVDIVHPETVNIENDSNLEFNFWTYNATNGATLTNISLNCTVYFINNKGVQYYRFSNQPGANGLMVYGKGAPSCINCWTMVLPKENLSIGDYSYQIKCQGSDIGGYTTGAFSVIENDLPLEQEKLNLYIFISLTPLVLMLVFLFFGYVNFKVGDKEENAVISFFFYGLAIVFLITHVIITNSVVQDLLIYGIVTEMHTTMMIGFFIIIGLIVGFMIIRMILKQMDNFYKRSGLR